MDTKMEMAEDKRINAIAVCADVLMYSIEDMRTTFKGDADMVEEITKYVDRICEILGLLGMGNMDEAKRLNIELIKEIEHKMELESGRCGCTEDQ